MNVVGVDDVKNFWNYDLGRIIDIYVKQMMAGAEEKKKFLSQLINSVMNKGCERKVEDNGDKDK